MHQKRRPTLNGLVHFTKVAMSRRADGQTSRWAYDALYGSAVIPVLFEICVSLVSRSDIHG